MNSAVQQSVTDEELAERLKGLKGATPQQVKRAVENPVSGLTLDDTLEKHRKDIIWEIRRQVGIGITQGDRYTTMAKRLAEQYDMSYKKAVRITRTETHRAREAGFNDSANETHGRLIGSGLVMAKTWQTMEDGAVRPNGKKKKTGANHVIMEGQTVLQDEDFELYSDGRKSGDKTPAPSQSGIASQDIHCRCYASRDIMTVEEFEALTGRKLDSKYHKQKFSEKETETVDISEDLSIINNTTHNFNSISDPMVEVTGCAYDSNPNEVDLFKHEIAESGAILVETDAEKLAYAQGLRVGEPGTVYMCKSASYSAWCHEMTHMRDDKADGWLGMRILEDTRKCAEREVNAYKVEMALAEKANRRDIVRRLEALCNEEISKYGFKYSDFD